MGSSDPIMRAITRDSLLTLEWIRRRSPAFDKQLRQALFKSGPITGEH